LKTLFGAAALALTMAVAPAYAATTFAQYEQVDGGPATIMFDDGLLTDTGGATGVLVLFNYLDTMPAALDGQIDAFMNVSSTGAPWGGTISFLRTSDLANLLTLTFSGATLAGAGGSGALFGSEPGGSVTYTSDFLDFTGQTEGNFSIGLSSIEPGFGANLWTADSVGTFGSDSGNGGGAIPEPATWAMMIMGFGGVGALMRRRRHELAYA
jgi:hypothetical protein